MYDTSLEVGFGAPVHVRAASLAALHAEIGWQCCLQQPAEWKVGGQGRPSNSGDETEAAESICTTWPGAYEQLWFDRPQHAVKLMLVTRDDTGKSVRTPLDFDALPTHGTKLVVVSAELKPTHAPVEFTWSDEHRGSYIKLTTERSCATTCVTDPNANVVRTLTPLNDHVSAWELHIPTVVTG